MFRRLRPLALAAGRSGSARARRCLCVCVCVFSSSVVVGISQLLRDHVTVCNEPNRHVTVCNGMQRSYFVTMSAEVRLRSHGLCDTAIAPSERRALEAFAEKMVFLGRVHSAHLAVTRSCEAAMF